MAEKRTSFLQPHTVDCSQRSLAELAGRMNQKYACFCVWPVNLALLIPSLLYLVRVNKMSQGECYFTFAKYILVTV